MTDALPDPETVLPTSLREEALLHRGRVEGSHETRRDMIRALELFVQTGAPLTDIVAELRTLPVFEHADFAEAIRGLVADAVKAGRAN